MNEIEQFTRGLNPILQGIIGSAIFALLLYIGRVLYRLLTDLNKNYKKRRKYNEVIKIVFHKKYLNSNGLYYFTQGYLFLIYRALENLLKGLIFLLIGHSLTIFFSTNYFEYLGIYFCIQEILSSLSWLNTKWSNKDLNKYDKEIVETVQKTFSSNDPLSGDK